MYSLPVKSIDGVPIHVDIVPKGNFRVRPAYAMTPTSLAIHNTGNADKGADAEMHSRYLHNNAKLPEASTRYAAWHFTVDDEKIYQHIPLNESGWHTGDGSGIHSGNRTAIGIEIAENSDGNYAKAEANAVKLVAYLLDLYKFSLSQVKPHQAYSGKYCPHIILDRSGGFATFTNAVRKYQSNGTVTVVSKSTSKSPNASNVDRVNDDYEGRRVESIYSGKEGLDFYSKASFNDKYKVGVLHKGEGFPTIVDKVKVGSSYMYEVKNSKGATYFVTAASKYVKVEGKATSKKKASSKANKVINGIKVVGYIQVVNVSNACYIVDRPSSTHSKNLATAKKGTKLPIAGSVPGWFEVIHNGKRAYVNEKYGKRV